MKVRGRFYVAFAMQLLLLLLAVVLKQHTSGAGARLVLGAVLVDAPDPAEDDRVVLRYPISSMARPAFDPAVGDRVYVAADDDTAPVVQPTKPGDGRVWIRGEVTARGGGRIEVEYGIERYRLPAPTAAPIDWDAGPIAVEVRVDGTGRAAIQHVLVDGRPVDAGAF